jgi:hypothetical protein
LFFIVDYGLKNSCSLLGIVVSLTCTVYRYSAIA